MKNKFVSIVKVALVILLLTVLAYKLLPAISSPEFRLFIERIGVLGPLIVIFYIVLSHVLAPVIGAPGLFVAFSIYGVYIGALLIYLASLISATINFWIARKLGRDWVTKLVGKNEMEKVDDFTRSSGALALILGRTLGFLLFEVVSYAAGLTNMSYRKYIRITALYTLIPHSIFTLFLDQRGFSDAESLLSSFGVMVAIGWALAIVMFRYLKKKS